MTEKDGWEIERKWLIKTEDIPYDLASLKNYHITQDYISFYPTIRLRDINFGEQYLLTVKTHPENGDDIARNEYETQLSVREYKNLKKMASGFTIAKTRYLHETGDGLLEEIDIFEDEFEGLAYLEIEFGDIEKAESYPSPDWVYMDVTTDSKYKNSALAENGKPEYY